MLSQRFTKAVQRINGALTVDDRGDGYYTINAPDVGYCRLNQLFGCCGTVVLSGMVITPTERDKKFSNVLIKAALEVAKEMGYTTVLCTIVTEKAAGYPMDFFSDKTQHLLAKYEFQEIYRFTNRSTKNIVGVFVHKLKYED